MRKQSLLLTMLLAAISGSASAGFIDVRPAAGESSSAPTTTSASAGPTRAAPEETAAPAPSKIAAPVVTKAEPAAVKPEVHKSANDSAMPSITGARRYSPTVAETGRRPAIFMQPKGMGRDIPVGESLKFLLPENFSVYTDEKVDLTHRASWTGGKNWPDVMSDLLKDAGMSATIAWDTKSLTLHPANSINANGAPVHSDKVLEDFIQKETAKLPEEKKLLPKWEILRADVSLRRSLTRWGKEAGWQLAWEASKDFPVGVEASVEASFDDAVAMVVESVSKSDYPIKAVFCEGNKTVLILRYGDNTEGVCK